MASKKQKPATESGRPADKKITATDFQRSPRALRDKRFFTEIRITVSSAACLLNEKISYLIKILEKCQLGENLPKHPLPFFVAQIAIVDVFFKADMVEGGEAKDGGHFLQVALAKIISVVNCVQPGVLVINNAAARN